MNEENKTNEAVELTDESLENVSGGSAYTLVNLTCPHCGWVNVIHLSENKYTCAKCNKVTEIMG